MASPGSSLIPRAVRMSSSSYPWTGVSWVTHGTPRWRVTSSMTPRVMMPSDQCSMEPNVAPSKVISFFGSRPFHIASSSQVWQRASMWVEARPW